MTGYFLFDVFIVKIAEFVGAAMLLISLWSRDQNKPNRCDVTGALLVATGVNIMKSLKGTGGLTHGGGMSEQQTAVDLDHMSSPISAKYNIAMQEFTNLSYTTSEQHKYRWQRQRKPWRSREDQYKACRMFTILDRPVATE